MRNKITAAAALLLGLVGIGYAVNSAPTPANVAIIKPINNTWSAGPSALPPNSKVLVLYGNPQAKSLYTIRLKLPANYVIPAHTHPSIEQITVISGVLHVGFGDQVNTASGDTLTAGSFMAIPPKTRHYAWTDKGAVIQLSGMGPWGIHFINPKEKRD